MRSIPHLIQRKNVKKIISLPIEISYTIDTTPEHYIVAYLYYYPLTQRYKIQRYKNDDSSKIILNTKNQLEAINKWNALIKDFFNLKE